MTEIRKADISFNMKMIGPGIWYTFHDSSSRADNPVKIRNLNAFMRGTCADLPCASCKSHAIEYLTTHKGIPEESTAEQSLYWTFAFHNHVNLCLEQPIADWEDVRLYFSSTKSCEFFCEPELDNESSSDEEIEPPSKRQRKFKFLNTEVVLESYTSIQEVDAYTMSSI
jgi:hypothetical protein